MAFYDDRRWHAVRQTIKRRDGYRCVMCNRSVSRFKHLKLEVHHIKARILFPQLQYEETNLVTLCADCHSFLHNEPAANEDSCYQYNLPLP